MRTRTVTKFVPRTRFQAVMARGHLNRLGHILTGFYITENGISYLHRTCACEKGQAS
jgi:hypothetical protein